MLLTYIGIGILLVLGVIFLEIKKLKILGQKIIILIFYGIAGLSYRIHNDFTIYEYIYNSLNFNNIMNLDLEWGYKILNLIFNKYIDFYTFKGIIFILNTILIYKGLKSFLKVKNIYLVLALLYLNFLQFYRMYLSAFRQSIAVSIFIFSLKYLEEKNMYKYYFCILLAFFFHKSAIILIFIPILKKFEKIKLSSLLLIYLIFNILVRYLYKLLPNYILKLEYFNLNEVLGIKNILLNIFFIIIGMIILKNRTKSLLMIYLIFNILARNIFIFYRIEFYFIIFFIFYIVEIIESLKGYMKLLFKYSLVIFMLFNYNLKVIYELSISDKKYIPLYFIFQNFYKDIKFNQTAEYRQLLHYSNLNRLEKYHERVHQYYYKKDK